MSRRWHWYEVCEYGKVHRQCRCPAEGKVIVPVECDTPDAHRPDAKIGEDG